MNICVIGVGYVGLVTGVVFADLGNDVICVDKIQEKVDKLNSGVMPIYEPGLEEMVARNVSDDRLKFTTDLDTAVKHAEVVFIAVGTPPGADGSTNMAYVDAAAEAVAKAMNGYKVIVNKSTVPVGTGERVRKIIEANITEPILFDVVSNPEFLREGSAISDSLVPDRIVIGAPSRKVAMKLLELYAPLERPMIVTDVASAEIIKYASNAFLAMKITFANSVANLCDAAGADIMDVAKGMGLDSRIGPAFLNAGIGYGGSCFPKDTLSLIHTAEALGCEIDVVKAVVRTNDRQPLIFIDKMRKALGGLNGKTIGVLGLAFKGNTDDLRDSKALDIVRALVAEGATVQAYDPVAMPGAQQVLPDIVYCKNAYEAAEGAHALAVVTEWNEFKLLNFDRIASHMKGSHVFDGRNLYSPKRVESYGLSYIGVGRSSGRPDLNGDGFATHHLKGADAKAESAHNTSDLAVA
jgi:UDPglucose 6-dehydrogenase